MGVTVIAGAVTTFGAGAVMLLCQMVFFTKVRGLARFALRDVVRSRMVHATARLLMPPLPVADGDVDQLDYLLQFCYCSWALHGAACDRWARA